MTPTIKLFKAVRPHDGKEIIISQERKGDGKYLMTIYVQVMQELVNDTIAEITTFGAEPMQTSTNGNSQAALQSRKAPALPNKEAETPVAKAKTKQEIAST